MNAPVLHKRAPLEFAHRVVTGFTRRLLARQFHERGYTTGAEIGVADGRYSRVLCEEVPRLRLTCVDPWQVYRANPRSGTEERQHANYQLAQERLKGYRVTFMRGFSMDAVRRVPEGSLDFVFIDGHHSFDFVMQDIIEWSRRVRKGGIVAGHDFYRFKWAGVCEAVVAYTQAHGIDDWSLTDEKEPSFWWVKR